MREVKLGRVYRHFKGDYYLVEHVAKHCETGETYVVTAGCGFDLRRIFSAKSIMKSIRNARRSIDLNCRISGAKQVTEPGRSEKA